GGVTDDGQPYYVMEFVDGQPLDQFCNEKRLSIRQRIELFRKVCAAVQYAHQNLVVHRDLKPDNIFVTKNGTPKLLDFGIAKLLQPETPELSATLTQDGSWLLTPAYASPEQVRDEPITTASDVYALGVLLYELLAGRKPYSFDKQTPAIIERTICEQVPARPSEMVAANGRTEPAVENWHKAVQEKSADKLRRRLHGDLDNIILKALQKEPQRRYESVQTLSEDLGRFLNGLPVFARSDSMYYRTSKFVRRHRVGVFATALILLSLVGGIIGVSWQARIAEKQRDMARAEASKAQLVDTFLQEMLLAADPTISGRDVKVVDVLDDAERRIGKEWSDQPVLEGTLRMTIGTAFQNLGLYEEALPHLQRALALRKKRFGQLHADVAESKHTLAVLLRQKGELPQAKQLFEEAINDYRQLAMDTTLGYAKTLNDYGIYLDELEKYQEAEKLFRTSLELESRLLGKDHFEIAVVLNNLGHALLNQGLLEEAEAHYREAIRIASAHGNPQAYLYLNNLGTLLQNKNNYAGASEALQQAVVIVREKWGEKHPHLGTMIQNLAANYFYEGNYQKAEKTSKDGLALMQSQLPENHPNLAHAKWWLGRILNAKGAFREAESPLRQALSIARNVYPANHWTITYANVDLGYALFKQKRYSQANNLLTKTYPALLKTPGDNSSAIRRNLRYLVELYENWHRLAQAAHFDSLLSEMK
ncbi:MAG: tetratricopeptide repeat protein, partial [bacterium]